MYKIDAETLKKIEDSQVTETEKIFNLLKSIRKYIGEEGERSPYLISIGEKAELIAKMYEEGQRRTKEILEELKQLIEEINAAREEQKAKNMTAEMFTIYWLLKGKEVKGPEEKANQMKDVFDKYPSWKWSEAQEREVRRGLFKMLIKAGKKHPKTVADEAKRILRILRSS